MIYVTPKDEVHISKKVIEELLRMDVPEIVDYYSVVGYPNFKLWTDELLIRTHEPWPEENASYQTPEKAMTPRQALTYIEMANDFDSLNVGVAAGILIDRMQSNS